jgi:hypothetical protein
MTPILLGKVPYLPTVLRPTGTLTMQPGRLRFYFFICFSLIITYALACPPVQVHAILEGPVLLKQKFVPTYKL